MNLSKNLPARQNIVEEEVGVLMSPQNCQEKSNSTAVNIELENNDTLDTDVQAHVRDIRHATEETRTTVKTQNVVTSHLVEDYSNDLDFSNEVKMMAATVTHKGIYLFMCNI